MDHGPVVGGHGYTAMMPMVLCVRAHGDPVGVVGVDYPSAACRICGQAIYDLAAYEDAQWWLCTHLITCHDKGGLMVELEPIEWMVRHEFMTESDPAARNGWGHITQSHADPLMCREGPSGRLAATAGP